MELGVGSGEVRLAPRPLCDPVVRANDSELKRMKRHYTHSTTEN